MLKQDLYEKTISILVDAYFNDTLENSNCFACAVGNLVAANMGYTYDKRTSPIGWNEDATWAWAQVHVRLASTGKQLIRPENYGGEAKKQIDATGYSFLETAKIEMAFENGYSGDDPMFNALCSVVSALDIIHENTDTEVTQNTKNRFVKQLA